MSCCPITSATSTGGVLCSGSALVEIVQDPYDGLVAVYPLDESGSGVAGEYLDRGRKFLHGTGGLGDGDLEYVPDRDLGVFCAYSQRFDGRQFVALPADDITPEQPFTVSLWGKIDSTYEDRTFYSRGTETADGDLWSFRFGYTFLNTLSASVQVLNSAGEIEIVEVYGSTTLNRGEWHHVACVVEPGVSVRLYLGGVLEGTETLSQTSLVPTTNGGYLLRWNEASVPVGNLQEVRIYPDVKSAAWLLAERDNYCLSGFFVAES